MAYHMALSFSRLNYGMRWILHDEVSKSEKDQTSTAAKAGGYTTDQEYSGTVKSPFYVQCHQFHSKFDSKE